VLNNSPGPPMRSRFGVRRTESTALFASSAALSYALSVGLLAALASTYLAGADDSATTLRYAADQLSAGWRSNLAPTGTCGMRGLQEEVVVVVGLLVRFKASPPLLD
jgi:hypothetical protein